MYIILIFGKKTNCQNAKNYIITKPNITCYTCSKEWLCI